MSPAALGCSSPTTGPALRTSSLLHLRRFGNASALADAFRTDPDLAARDVRTQQTALDGALGPFSAPLTAELRRSGWQADDLILGVPSIREAWVREHGPLPQVRGVDDPDLLLALGEIQRSRPEVVLDGNLNVIDRTTSAYLRTQVPAVRLLVGRMGTAKRFHRALHLDVTLTPCHVMADALRPLVSGAVNVLPHSFNPAVLDTLPPRSIERPLIFTGTLGPRYVERHRVLMALLESTPTEAYFGLRKGVVRRDDGALAPPTAAAGRSIAGRLADALPMSVLRAGARKDDRFADHFNARVVTRFGGTIPPVLPLEDPAVRFPERCHPPLAGRAYLELLRGSGVVVHREGDDMDTCGGALRLFEVTGMGSVLLTDASAMLHQLFVDGREVLLYDSPEDGVEKARWLLEHPEERDEIAAAGQARTLRDHTTAVRASQLAELLSHALR